MQEPSQACTNLAPTTSATTRAPASSRKIPGGVISVASSAPTKCLEAITLSAIPFAAVRLPFLVPAFDT